MVLKISKHITYDEATKSQTAIRAGIKNTPNEQQLKNMKSVAIKCFEPLRVWYNKPLRVSSFFRCKELNSLIKGSKTSQHMEGKAIDINAGSKSENKKVFEWCKANLEFDQLIDEFDYSWVHISFNSDKPNRNQVLIVK